MESGSVGCNLRQGAVSAALPRYALAHHFRATRRSAMAGLRTNRFRLLRQDDTARDARLTLSEERLRAARQQEAVAHLGQQALAGAPVAELIDAAVALATRALEVEFASLLELRPENRTLLLRAGLGWRAGAVGRTILPADADSHAGYVLRSTGQVVVEDLTTDRRVGSSPLLAAHGGGSGLRGLGDRQERPVGVLGGPPAPRRAVNNHDAHLPHAGGHHPPTPPRPGPPP